MTHSHLARALPLRALRRPRRLPSPRVEEGGGGGGVRPAAGGEAGPGAGARPRGGLGQSHRLWGLPHGSPRATDLFEPARFGCGWCLFCFWLGVRGKTKAKQKRAGAGFQPYPKFQLSKQQ